MRRIGTLALWALAAGAMVSLTVAPANGQTTPSPQTATPTTQVAPPPQNEEPGVRKAKELLAKMVQALGGDAYLNMQDMSFSGRTYGFNRGEPSGAGAQFWDFWKWPDKERIELTKQRDWIIIHNGDKGYEITFRGTAPEEDDALQDYLRRRYYSLQQVLRVWVHQPGIAYFYDGFATAERKPAQQVTLMNTRNEAVTIYIDQDNFLPIKKDFTWRDPKTRERNDESEIYDNYRDVQGIMTPFSVTRKKNGLNVNQRFITEVKYNQNLPDSLFDASVTVPKKK
jgi:hypothetical protein